MNERQEIISTRWTFWIAVLGFLWVPLSVGYIAISSLHLQVVRPRALASYLPLPMERISDLQYSSSSGGLIVAVESDLASRAGPWVEVYTWDHAYQPAVNPPMVSLDFGQLTGEPATLIPPYAAYTGESPRDKRPSSTQAATGLPYALSEDGSTVAWSWKGKLFAGPLQEPKKFQLQLDPPTPVVALSFFDRDVVGVIHTGGEFRLVRFRARDQNLGGMPLKGAWRISGRGPFRVLSNFAAGDGLLVKTIPRLSYRNFAVSAAGTFITASTGGKVAMGTNDGVIVFPQPSGEFVEVRLPEMGRIQTLAFVDEQKLIAGVAGTSLFLVEDETRPTRLTAAPRGVRLLAVDLSRIAMVTSSAIVVADLEERLVLDERGRLGIAITFYILSLIALLRLIIADGRKLCALKRRLAAQTLSPPLPRNREMEEGDSRERAQPAPAGEDSTPAQPNDGMAAERSEPPKKEEI